MRSRRRTPAGGVQAEKQRRYAQLIAQGVNNSEACRVVGIDRKTGNRWRYGRKVRNSAGALVIYPPVKIIESRPRSPRYLSEQERIRIADLLAAKVSVRGIAEELGRAPSTISREIRRNRDPDGRYRPHHAEHAARCRACKPRTRRIAGDEVLGEVVQRLLSKRWSPEQVAHELRVLFADQPLRWLCKETIYQAIYDTAVALTRPVRRRRRRRRLLGMQRRGRLTAMRMIDERPAEVEDRLQAGHWEGDLIMGAGNRSAIGTLVERTTRFLILLPFTEGVATHRRCPPRDHRRTGGVAGRAAANADLGSRQGACAAPADHHGDRHGRVLLRRALTVAARQQREHERAAARLLPEGHRPERPHRRGRRADRRRAQRPATQDARLAAPRRAVRRRERGRLTGPTRAAHARGDRLRLGPRASPPSNPARVSYTPAPGELA